MSLIPKEKFTPVQAAETCSRMKSTVLCEDALYMTKKIRHALERDVSGMTQSNK